MNVRLTLDLGPGRAMGPAHLDFALARPGCRQKMVAPGPASLSAKEAGSRPGKQWMEEGSRSSSGPAAVSARRSGTERHGAARDGPGWRQDDVASRFRPGAGTKEDRAQRPGTSVLEPQRPGTPASGTGHARCTGRPLSDGFPGSWTGAGTGYGQQSAPCRPVPARSRTAPTVAMDAPAGRPGRRQDTAVQRPTKTPAAEKSRQRKILVLAGGPAGPAGGGIRVRRRGAGLASSLAGSARPGERTGQNGSARQAEPGGRWSVPGSGRVQDPFPHGGRWPGSRKLFRGTIRPRPRACRGRSPATTGACRGGTRSGFPRPPSTSLGHPQDGQDGPGQRRALRLA